MTPPCLFPPSHHTPTSAAKIGRLSGRRLTSLEPTLLSSGGAAVSSDGGTEGLDAALTHAEFDLSKMHNFQIELGGVNWLDSQVVMLSLGKRSLHDGTLTRLQ